MQVLQPHDLVSSDLECYFLVNTSLLILRITPCIERAFSEGGSRLISMFNQSGSVPDGRRPRLCITFFLPDRGYSTPTRVLSWSLDRLSGNLNLHPSHLAVEAIRSVISAFPKTESVYGRPNAYHPAMLGSYLLATRYLEDSGERTMRKCSSSVRTADYYRFVYQTRVSPTAAMSGYVRLSSS